MPKLTVAGLKVAYGANEVVHGVDFEVAQGEIVGIVGESGSGKSTVAKALMGIEHISGGKVANDLGVMQMIFQDAVGSLNPRMKVRAAIGEVLRHFHSTKSVESILDQVGLSPTVLEQFPRELSGGQCQRVSIARALATEPKILIADEPVSALDVSIQARILNLLRDLRERLGLSILLIAHDLAVVKNVCDRVYVMEKGTFVDSGVTELVFTNPHSEYTRRLLAAVPRC